MYLSGGVVGLAGLLLTSRRVLGGGTLGGVVRVRSDIARCLGAGLQVSTKALLNQPDSKRDDAHGERKLPCRKVPNNIIPELRDSVVSWRSHIALVQIINNEQRCYTAIFVEKRTATAHLGLVGRLVGGVRVPRRPRRSLAALESLMRGLQQQRAA